MQNIVRIALWWEKVKERILSKYFSNANENGRSLVRKMKKGEWKYYSDIES